MGWDEGAPMGLSMLERRSNEPEPWREWPGMFMPNGGIEFGPGNPDIEPRPGGPSMGKPRGICMPGGGGNDLKFCAPDGGGKNGGIFERGPIMPGIIEPWLGNPFRPGGMLPMFNPGGPCMPGGSPMGGIGELGCPW